MTGPKVVPFDRDGCVASLMQIVNDLESGKLAPVDMGVLVLEGKDGAIEVFGLGSQTDVESGLGLLRVGEQLVVESLLRRDLKEEARL